MDAESAVVFPQQVTQQIPHGPVAVLTPAPAHLSPLWRGTMSWSGRPSRPNRSAQELQGSQMLRIWALAGDVDTFSDMALEKPK